uniref:Uncharacterized protein n=1 Tax=Parascaris univalens TaxID=6257 RepID=A0A914ZYA6_PARUN
MNDWHLQFTQLHLRDRSIYEATISPLKDRHRSSLMIAQFICERESTEIHRLYLRI